MPERVKLNLKLSEYKGFENLNRKIVFEDGELTVTEEDKTVRKVKFSKKEEAALRQVLEALRAVSPQRFYYADLTLNDSLQYILKGEGLHTVVETESSAPKQFWDFVKKLHDLVRPKA